MKGCFFKSRIISVLIYLRYPCNVPKRTAVDLAYKIYGNGSGVPIIVLHGLLGSKKNWRSISDNLASEFDTKVIAADARNHGDSPHALPHTYPELAFDLAQLIRKLSLEKVILIGHSMGGRTIMTHALTQGENVHSMIVVDISPISTAVDLSNFLPRVLAVMESIKFDGLNLEQAKDLAVKSLIDAGVAKRRNELHFVMNNIIVKDNVVRWMCNVQALAQHFDDMASFPSELLGNQYPGKVLFIGGRKSPFIPPQDLPDIQKLFPQARLLYVDGAGHNVHAEATSTFLRMIITFLKS